MLLNGLVRNKINTKSENDTRLISVAKTLSWRVIGTLDTMLISYFITGEWLMAFSIGSIELFTKMLLYYLHERAWEKYRLKKQYNNENR